MSTNYELRKQLARPTPELVRGTVAGELAWGLFLTDDRPHVEISGLGPLVAEIRADRQSPEFWSGLSLLSSWAPTPIEIGGELFSCVESFHHALKYPEGSAERAEIALLDGPSAQYRARRRRGPAFTYRGETILVDSPEHAAIIALAITEKVRRHRDVAEALLATSRGRLIFSYGKNALGIATPLALMIERAKLQR